MTVPGDGGNGRRKLTRRQRIWLISLTGAFIISLLGLYQFSLPSYASLPPLLQPLYGPSVTPGATPTATPWRYRPPTATFGDENFPDPKAPPTTYYSWLPFIVVEEAPARSIDVQPEPPAAPPTPNWPPGLDRQTASKMGLHVVRNNDPFIMEFVRRVRPRVMKAVDDVGWLADVKAVSPNTVTIGRFNGQDETWPDTKDPVQAAKEYVAMHLERYRMNPGVDYWEGWNEFVPVTRHRWEWYTEFEAARACEMQAHGLRAAVGGFVAGAPEWNEIPIFIPALEAAHRCGGIFTLHEGVSPLFGCGVFSNKGDVIPGAPGFADVTVGYMMLRYRFWYEGYLKARGIGDLPLVISELAVAGIVPGQACNGPGGADWKPYQEWWIQNGIGPNGPQAYVNLLAWYDAEMRKDSYVIGATIFTAGAVNATDSWNHADIHDVIIPLAYYAVELQ